MAELTVGCHRCAETSSEIFVTAFQASSLWSAFGEDGLGHISKINQSASSDAAHKIVSLSLHSFEAYRTPRMHIRRVTKRRSYVAEISIAFPLKLARIDSLRRGSRAIPQAAGGSAACKMATRERS